MVLTGTAWHHGTADAAAKCSERGVWAAPLPEDSKESVRFVGGFVGEESLVNRVPSKFLYMAGDWSELFLLRADDFAVVCQTYAEPLLSTAHHTMPPA